MSDPIAIVPSILAADFTRLGDQIAEAESAGADMIHVDVMDGRFVPNITMGPFIVEAARRSTRLPLDVHLMIVEPERYVQAFASAGADRITVHIEATPNLHRVLGMIQEQDCKVGVALNPHTAASALSEVMHLLDVILVMTVNPGFGGQKFLTETLPKIRQLREMVTASGRSIDIGVDGGIYATTAADAVNAGANVLVAGSSVFNTRASVAACIQALRDALP